MWLTAVVDRLVVRNTSVSDVKAASRIFVRAWSDFSSEVLHRAREARISSGGEDSICFELLFLVYNPNRNIYYPKLYLISIFYLFPI